MAMVWAKYFQVPGLLIKWNARPCRFQNSEETFFKVKPQYRSERNRLARLVVVTQLGLFKGPMPGAFFSEAQEEEFDF